VLAAGRLSPEKGHDLAIEAAALAGVPLWIAGDGPAAAELAQLGEQRLEPRDEFVPPDAQSLRQRIGRWILHFHVQGCDVRVNTRLDRNRDGLEQIGRRTRFDRRVG
jgi:glycosyltransferase involved in cell wall biosynthesis